MTGRITFTRRRLGKTALAGATLIGAPLPLRHASAQAPANLKVALLLPTSGIQAQIGQACRRGADVANDVLADMKLAVKLDIVNHDTESKPDVARTQAEKAIDGGAQMLVGAFDSGQTIAIAQVAEQRGIPFVVNIAAAPQITEQGYKFVVRNFPTAPMLITGALALHKEIFKVSGTTPKTAVLMSVNDTFGTSMVNGIKALFPKLDMPYEIVDTITYDPAAKDLSVEVGKAKATKADMLMPVSRLNDAKLLVQEMVKPIAELLVGARVDPQFGPVIVVGGGGLNVELFKDVAIRLAPVTDATALAMIRSTKTGRLLEGWRGQRAGDVAAAAQAIAALSRFISDFRDDLSEVEINPLAVLESGKGCRPLDCLIVRRDGSAG